MKFQDLTPISEETYKILQHTFCMKRKGSIYGIKARVDYMAKKVWQKDGHYTLDTCTNQQLNEFLTGLGLTKDVHFTREKVNVNSPAYCVFRLEHK